MKKSILLVAVLMALVSLCLVFAGCDSGSSDSSDPTPPPEPVTCTISFDANGGSGSMAPVDVEAGASYQVPACAFTAPSGKEFKCWNNGTADINVGETIVVGSNITLTAQWQEQDPLAPGKYRVTFDLNGKAGTAPTYQDIDLGEKATVPNPAPTATGYTFEGWYKDTACTATEAWDFGNDTIDEEKTITLYAKWTAIEYTITYMDKTVEFPAVLHGKEYPTKHTYGTATTLKSASVPGYTFEGWYEEETYSTKVESLGATEYTGNITLYAKLNPIEDHLTGVFTVNNTGKKVNFSKGNLYWDGSKYQFEENQYDTASSWDANHVSHLFWVKSTETAIKPYDETYGTPSPTNAATDTFFAATSEKKWGTLSSAEWDYLLNIRANASNLKKYGVTVCDKTNCLILAPDNWDTSGNPLQTSYDATAWAAAEAAGLVCLPAAGYRGGSDVLDVGSSGNYWSATSGGSDVAVYLFFSSSDAVMSNDMRYYGCSVRLVVAEN